MSRDPLIGPKGGDTRFESAQGDVKHSKNYKKRQAARRPRINLKERDAQYRRALGLSETAPLPSILGTVPMSNNGSKGRRRKFERTAKYRARNTTMKAALKNVR